MEKNIKIIYAKSAQKSLLQLDKARARQILLAIEGLTKNPPIGDIKTIKGRPNAFRLREDLIKKLGL